MILIAALGIGVLTAMLNSYQGILYSFESYFEEYGFPDVTIMSTSLFGEEALHAAGALSGVDDVQGRLCVDMEATKGEDTFVSLRCYSIGETDFMRYSAVDRLSEAGDPAAQGEEAERLIPMAMEVHFAECAGFVPGDVFTLKSPKGDFKCVLSGIVSSPEWNSIYRDKYFNFSTDEFGYVLFSYEDLLEMTGLPSGTYNQLMLRTQADIPAEDVEQQLLSSGWFGDGAASYTYEASPQKEFMDSCVNPLKSLSYFLAFFFFLISALMVYLFLYQIIWEQKEESGIFMALGVSEIRIAAVYLGFGLGVSVLAGLTGTVTGYFLTRLISGVYQDVFILPYLVKIFSPGLALAASLLMTLVMLCSFLLASVQIFRMDPADAMRNQLAQSRGKASWKIFGAFGYAAKVCLCSALRNKRRLMLSLLSTILSVTLISLSFQYVDAGKRAVKHTFGERLLYDCQVFFKNDSTKEEVEAALADIEEIQESEVFFTATMDIEAAGKTVSATVYGVEPASSLLRNRGPKGALLQPEDGIVLARYTADALQLSVGDPVSVGGKLLTVTGIHEENIILVQYVSHEVFSGIAEAGAIGAFLELKEGVTKADIYSALQEKEVFSYLSMKAAQQISVENRLNNTEVGVYIEIVMAFLIGAVIIYNMSLINLKERKRVYATMLTLGMQETELGRASFAELAAQYVFSMLVGCLAGSGLGKPLLEMTSTESIYYTKAFSLSSMLLIGACVGAFMVLGHLLALRQMKEIDLVEELKSKE
ncbi:MAG: ABC transporter permease [Firmicutes bacterium]|nr:ABC transporter permease [Bacillota bacterium]